MRLRASLFGLLCATITTAALADFQSAAVVQLANVAKLQSGNYTNTPQVHLSGYYTANDGGGGDFCTLTPVSSACPNGLTPTTPTMTGATRFHGSLNTLAQLSADPTVLKWGMGMRITDSLGAIPANTYIASVNSTVITLTQNTTSPQTGDTFTISCANGGTILADNAGNCFYRTNTSAVMDFRQWGITIGSVYDANAHLTSMTDTSGIFQAASALAVAQGIVQFTTGGVSVFWASSYVPPANTSLACDAPAVTQISSGYYVGLPGTIYTAHGATYAPVNDQDGVGLHWCLRVPEWYANPARVSQFSGIAFNSPPLTYDDGENMRANMALSQDVCLDLNQVKGAQIDHVGCMGFDIGHSFKSSDHMNLSYFWADANVGMYGQNGGGQSDSSTVDIEPFLTKKANIAGATCAPTSNSADTSTGMCNEIYYSVTGMAAAGTTNSFGEPECSVTVGLANFAGTGHTTTGWPGTLLKSSQTFSNGDGLTYLVWMANFDTIIGAGKANALGCKRSGLPIVVTASGSTSATFTIKGSAYSTGASKMSMVASWASGISAPGTTTTQCPSGCGLLRIVSGDALNIQPGMVVADDGAHGIPVGSTVVAVVRGCKGPDIYDGYISCIFISNPTALAAVDATITFDGGTFTSEGTCDGARVMTCAFFNSDERPFTGDDTIGQLIQNLPISFGHHRGACYFSNGVAGWRQYSPFCYGHSYRFIFGNSNNWVTTDAHDDDNGELDWLDAVGNYTYGSTSYGSMKGNGFTKDADTVVVDDYNLNQSLTSNTTTSGTVSGAVGSTITSVGSMGAWRTDGGNGTVTGKLTVAMCQSIGANSDCSSLSDNQYFTVELTSANTLKILACGQYNTVCQGYTNGANLFFVQVSSANDSVSFSNLVADTTDVSQNVLDVFHGSPVLTDFQDKGVNRFAYVSGNITPTVWNGFDAPLSDVLYDGAASISMLSGCGNIFAGYNTTPPTLSQASSLQWQCSVSGQIPGVFTPTGASVSTTLPNFGDRALSMLDFGGTPNCSTANATAFSAAETAALAQGVHVLRLDGTTVGSCYALANHTIPSGITYWCPGPPASQPTNNDYRNFPNTISLTGSGGITLSSQSKIVGCNLIKSALTSGAPPTDYQGNYARSAAYAGTAVTFNGDGSGISQSMVVGFAACFLQGAGRTFWIQDAVTDCNQRDKFLKTNAGGMIFDSNGVQAPFGTRGGTGGPVNQINVPFATAADNGAGLIRIHLPSPCSTTNCPLTGDKLWLINTTPYQSAQGGWVPTVIDTSNFDLQGSDSGFLAGKAFTGVTVTIGSNEIIGLSLTSINQVQPTQSVTGACIPAGAQVQFREPYYGIIWLMDASGNPLNATCSSTPTETITITDQATGVTSITADGVSAPGTLYVVGDHLQPTGGTVVTGDDADLVVNSVDPTTGAVTASPDIADGGSYTVCPPDGSGVTDLTTPAATGATFHFACTGAVALYANNRTGAALQIQNVNALRVSNMNVLSSEICVEWDKGSNDVDFEGVACHDQNALQDQTHRSIVLNGPDSSNGSVGQNKFCNGGLYYFGGILDLSQSTASTSGNVFCNNTIVGPKGAGLQKTVLDVASPSGAKKNSITFIGNSGIVNGMLFIPNDVRSAQFSDNDFPSSYLLGQSAATYGLLSGAGNHFASGSMAISPGATTLNTASAFAGGGQASATKLTADFVRVNAVATAGDSVMLRPAVAGAKPQTLTNASTRVMQVYGFVGTADTINGIASATGVPQAPGSTVQYSVTVTGAYSATLIGPSGTNVLCPVSQPCVYTVQQTINQNTVAAPAPATAIALQLVGNDSGLGNAVEQDAIGAAAAYQGVRYAGTLASPTAVPSGAAVSSFSARSYDGVSVPVASEAYVRGVTAENQSATNHGHDVTAGCTPIGSSGTAAECARFNSLFAQLEAMKFYGSAPAVTGTGSPTIASGSTDNAGEVTGGTSATSIIITFNVAKTNAPFCTVSPQTSVASFVYAISTTAITVTQTATTGQKIDYICTQH